MADEGRALAVVESRAEWSDADLRALADSVAKDCNAAQFRVFVMAARRLGLDPFARQIVPIVQGVKMTPQITIDGFRLIAERTGRYAGQIGPQWCGADGVWHDVWLSESDPVACKVGVLRRDFDQPMWGVARTKAYKSGTPTWGKMSDVMIAKVAESLALRKAFPQELSGVYGEEEMASPVVERGGVVVPAAAATVDASSDPSPGTSPAVPSVAGDGRRAVVGERAAKPGSFGELRERARAVGVVGDDWERVCAEQTGTSDPRRMSASGKEELKAYVERLEAAHAAIVKRTRGEPVREFPEELDLEELVEESAVAAAAGGAS